MISQKTIKLYVYVDGVNDVPFYGVSYGDFVLANGEIFTTKEGFVFNVVHTNEQIEIGSFRYDAKRMGAAPTISFTLMYEECLDDFWSENVYAIFNGEKYFLKQTPTSSLSSDDSRYKHDVELVSARVILDNVLFYDAISGDSQGADKPISNSTNLTFFGTIAEFADRLNASLLYTKLQRVNEDGTISGYRVIVDEHITSEAMLVSFSNAYFSNAIQESYNTYKVPYYFVGEEIHFGNSNGVIAKEFRYGVDDALLSITKTNANNKIVNRITGTGSSENLPYYYPNKSSKGDVQAVEGEMSQLGVKILNYETFVNKVEAGGTFTYQSEGLIVDKVKDIQGNSIVSGKPSLITTFTYKGGDTKYLMSVKSLVSGTVNLFLNPVLNITRYQTSDDTTGVPASGEVTVRIFKEGTLLAKSVVGDQGHTFSFELPYGNSTLEIRIAYKPEVTSSTNIFKGTEGLSWATDTENGWYYNGKEVQLKDYGLAISSTTPQMGDTITQVLGNYIKTSNVLLPPKYRETNGEERFYNATNDTYVDEQRNDIEFNNPFVEGHPKEHIINMEDIKPTIKGMEVNGLRIDMFSEFAYDEDDNDETYEDEEGNTYFKHPYFYGKLRKMDFNLFDSANENQEMVVSFTSGNCGACSFVIGATEEYPQKNPVQVDNSGNLKYKDGRVWCGVEGIEGQAVTEYQDRQQDTSKYEVWVALRKEEETYGVLMPSGSIKPKACTEGQNDGDTFVIIGINLPQSYILQAEERLEKEIIKYLKDNNVEKFNFSINFSRIYFEENPDVLELLNENASIYVWYNNAKYTLYVSSISYSMGEGEVLPDIKVDLVDSLSVAQSAVQSAISEVKAQMGSALANLDILTLTTPYFIRKDQDDEVVGNVNFKKGIKFGEGGRVDILDNNSAKLTIEYLEVTKKATFTSLEIQEKTHVGGQMLITPAAMNCGEVEELEDAYRCYFQTQGQDGDEIFNQFAVGDQAICQTFNAWGSRYFWRLVTGVGEDYIDLSKTDCDEGSDIPMAGDKIIQLGHRTDKTRQAAQVLSAHGETAPAFIMYNRINDYTLEGKEVTGILWNPATQEPQMYSYGNFFFGDRTKDENGEFISDFITFQPNPENPEEKKLFINADVQFGGGSKGLSDLSDWQDLQREVDTLDQSIVEIKQDAEQTTEELNKAIEDAEKAAKDYTDEGKAALQKSIDELNAAKAGINEVYTKAAADGLINSAEQRANEKAQEVADEAQRLAELNANAYADGVADDAELAAIADAEAKLATAKGELNASIEEVREIASTADAATKTLDTKITNVETGMTESVNEINARLDGVVENYFEEGVPTTSNYPANEWTTDAEKANHVGDTYTNISSYDEDPNNAGKSWRWTFTDSEHTGYHWHPIADSDAVKALLEASKAKTAADGKARNFVTQPKPPYSVGDTWMQGASGEIMRCKVARESGSYTASDWEVASKYTDDTKANEAKGVADAARTRLTNWASDSYISPTEKRGIKDEKTFVLSDSEEIIQDAAKYSVDATSFTSATTAYVNELDRIINATAENVPVQNLVTIQGNYYNERTAILEAIATEAKGAIDAAFSEASRAITNANEAKTKAENAVKDAQAAKDTLTEWASDGVISPVEKQALKTEMSKILSDYNDINHQRTLYDSQALGDSWRDYADAWTLYIEELENIIIEEGSVEIGDLASLQSSYYDARTTVLSDIADAAKALADSKVSPDDVQYLKDTFGQVTSGQVFLGKLMGVGTGVDASINAYMDGSGLVSNTTDGKLMLAMGIPTGSGTLATRAASASTRIYEKGKIITNDINLSGVISAKQGNVGLQYFDDEHYVSFRSNPESYWGITNIVQEGAGLSVVTQNASVTQKLRFGVGGLPNIGGNWLIKDKDGNTIHETLTNTYTQGGVIIEQTGFSNAALVIKKLNNTDSIAFDCQQGHIRVGQGMFEGLRPKTRDVSSGETLTEYDYNVFCSSGTIYLPKSPILGQTYDIFHTSTTSITINGNGNNIYCLDGSNGLKSGTSHSTSQARRLHLVWGGANWYLDSNMW